MTKDELRNKMKMYRLGTIALPQEYIDLHQLSARIGKNELTQRLGVRVLAEEMVTDGWIDGMQVLRYICEDFNGKLRDIRWSDANGGSWFEKLASGGQTLLFSPTDKPGYL